MSAMVDRHHWVRGATWLAALLLTGLASPVWSAACDVVFTNGAQSHSSSGSVNADFQTEITGGGSQLDTPSLTTGGQVTCGGSNCSASGTPAATGAPTFEVGSGSDGDINAAGPQGNVTNVSEGDYTSVSVVQERVLSFSTTAGVYLMESLASNFQSEIRFSSGDYWIDGDMTIGQETDLVLQDGGTVRIFVNGNVSLGYQVESSGFSPEQLLIYATGNITLTGNQVRLSGFLYAGGQFQSSFQSEISGGVSGASVDLENETSIEYAGGVLGTADFAPFCGGDGNGVDPELVSEWRMDESAWSGTSGEVLDQSGNGNHGTAQGDAGTDDTSPATPGDPGTCGYGQFDGSGDYVSVPGLSNTLNATASLAFWIRTTQVGNDTIWQAPGVTGVEEAGGTDDIFWGWLDSQGHIGVSVANDSSTKSQASINDGNWHHVVLTRDHLVGEYRVYIDGNLDADGNIATGVIGTGYDRIGSIVDTAGSHEYLNGDLDEVRVYDGVLTESEVADIYADTHPCSSAICQSGTPVPGLFGEYFDNQSLNGDPEATRVDAPVQFSWENNEGPSVLGGQDDNFSMRWEGRVFVTATGNYRFRTLSDDGVRLWVDGQEVVDNWDDHGVETDTTSQIQLEADQAYDIQLEFYENGGRAQIELLWSTPSNGNFVPVPEGDSNGTAAGLYHCPGNQVVGYVFFHSEVGVTCEAESVRIEAVDAAGNPVAPPAGTEILLGTDPANSDASWVGGNSYIFPGDEVDVVLSLSQTSPAELVPELEEVGSGTLSRSTGSIIFADTGLRFYGSLAGGPMPNQVAGSLDSNPVLRVVKTDDDSGACVNALSDDGHPVDLAYECRNPAVCVVNPVQTLTLAGSAITPNNRNQALAYTTVELDFDDSGFAEVPFQFSDVGRIRLHGRTSVEVEGDPSGEEILVTGSSDEFVVKPYSLRVSSVQTLAGVESPGTDSNAGTEPDEDAFVAAGEPFSVTVEAVDPLGNVTPNFGNENPAEDVRLELTGLSYPPGGDLGELGGENSFTPDGGGYSSSDTVTWNNVGAVRVMPRLEGDNYLAAGDLPQLTESPPLGRFYPYDFSFPGGSVEDACNAGDYSYMGHMAIKASYAINARNFANEVVSNYDDSAGYNGTATVRYVAENNGAGDGASLSARVQVDDDEAQWIDGVLSVNPSGADLNAAFLRALNTQPDGPYEQLVWGVILEDNLDNRPSDGLNMNAADTGDCTVAGNCTAWALNSTLDARFGRLKLEDAFGPEVLDLSAPFYTEYWNGTEFIRNADDSCTRIPRSAITYEPTGTLADDNNRTVPLGGGSTTGQYDNLDAVGVNIDNSYSGQTFTAPGEGNTGSFDILVNLTDRPWLIFDWNQDGDHNNDVQMPPANVGFGSYRGHDRIIYWREVLE